ncbi:MAG: beta-N-acetylhexosaminidase, partial [Promethearchaeota archaeon]
MKIFTNIAIIPEPVSLSLSKGEFILNSDTSLRSDKSLLSVSEHLKEFLSHNKHFNLDIKEFEGGPIHENSINLILSDVENKIDNEGYLLEITTQNIQINASSPAGAFYAFQTLRQLLPIELESNKLVNDSECRLSCLKIEDFPRFSWRGYMLDEARHFHGKEVVKKLLDLMALLKMNIFHWHLTDDQGWRIEIKRYPKLTEIGSRREETQIGGFLNKKTNGIPHSGYYSQEEIQEIVNYAKDRFITIIPEIDMPGHTRAVLASYNNLGCKSYIIRVSPHWGIHKDVLCIGNEDVFDFVQGVLEEIITLFPSDVIHIGGDEVPTHRWKECPSCQSRLNEEGLSNEKEIQVYFTNRIASYLNSKDKRVMGWNEILNENLKSDVICQYWIRGKDKVINHLRKNGKVVMSNFRYVYLDHSYSFTPLKLAYEFEPLPKKLQNQYYKNVLGLEALMWGEFIPTTKRLEWQTFPRLIAFSEVSWTPKERKNYHSFQDRLDSFLKRLDILGVNYANKKEVNPGPLKRKTGLFTLIQA